MLLKVLLGQVWIFLKIRSSVASILLIQMIDSRAATWAERRNSYEVY